MDNFSSTPAGPNGQPLGFRASWDFADRPRRIARGELARSRTRSPGGRSHVRTCWAAARVRSRADLRDGPRRHLHRPTDRGTRGKKTLSQIWCW